MKVDDIVCEIIDSVLRDAFLFPMRCSFQSLANAVTDCQNDTFSAIKESCRDTIPSLPAEMKEKFVSQKSASKSMQIMRAAVIVFNVLDLTVSRCRINSSSRINDDCRARSRSRAYDENVKFLRSLYGTLPIWLKSLPTMTITLMRCAVKVAQQRYMKAIAGLDGDDVTEVFTNYAKGDTIIELDKLCDKLKRYLSVLRCFIEKSYAVSEEELTAAEVECVNQFREAANRSTTLLMQFNSCVPILHALNSRLRMHVEEAWKSKCEDVGGTISDHWFGNHKGLLFSEKALSSSPVDVFADIRFLQNVASDSCDIVRRIGDVQVSAMISSEKICSTVAETIMASLKSIGYIGERTESRMTTDSTKTAMHGGTERSAKVKYIRNSRYQMDVYCLWNSIVDCDRILEADVSSCDRGATSGETSNLSDTWYENLFNAMLVPCIVQSAVSIPNSDKIQSALAYVLSRHIVKRS